MSERRVLLWVRLLVGVGFMYRGVAHVTGMGEAAELFAAESGWQGWPLVGGLRPLELVLWLALLEFFLGVFLFGGLLTRILAVVGLAVGGLQVAALGPASVPLALLLTLGSAALVVRGGGAGTMDTVLGKMQRRSIEREEERRRARALARHEAEAARQEPDGDLSS